jgi:hypothetical protein
MSANASEPGPSTSVANSAAVEQKPLEQLGTLEEDDEFEVSSRCVHSTRHRLERAADGYGLVFRRSSLWKVCLLDCLKLGYCHSAKASPRYDLTPFRLGRIADDPRSPDQTSSTADQPNRRSGCEWSCSCSGSSALGG